MIALPLVAQEEHKARRHFAVASIKPNQSGLRALQGYSYSPGGRFAATNATLVDMIVRVYPTRRIQMRGGPDWIDSERFDVAAKSDPDEGEVQADQWTQMVQVLLEDRFKLQFHTEMRETGVLALVVEKTGPKLQPAKEDEQTSMTPGEGGQMIFRKMSMTGLVNTMANILKTPVVDRTGITGFFDFTLDPNRFAIPEADGAPSKDSFGESLVTAVREQLGLRLNQQRASLEITVVDRAERPSGN